MGIFDGSPKFRGNWFKEHSLSIVLLTIFVIQAIITWFSGIPEWTDQQIQAGSTTALFPGYVIHWIYDFTTSLVADTYGAVLLVLFSKWFFEKGSAESRNKDPEQ